MFRRSEVDKSAVLSIDLSYGEIYGAGSGWYKAFVIVRSCFLTCYNI
jgi:hypothetical protein